MTVTFVPLSSYLLTYLQVSREIHLGVLFLLWVAGVIGIGVALRYWEESVHVISHEEEDRIIHLLKMTHNLSTFAQFFDEYLQEFGGPHLTHSIYVKSYENDASLGLTKVAYGEDGSVKIGNYADLIIPANETTFEYLLKRDAVIKREEVQALARNLNISLPGGLIYPIVHPTHGVLGIWVIQDEIDNISRETPPVMVFAVGRWVLTHLLLDYHLEQNRESGVLSDNRESYYQMQYAQTVNLLWVFTHELQTPLAKIYTYLSLWRKRNSFNPDEVEMLLESTRSLSQRISKFAEYARQLTEKPEDNHTLVRSVASLFTELQTVYKKQLLDKANAKGVKVKTQLPSNLAEMKVKYNAGVIKGIAELLENAIVYSPKSSNVFIQVTLHRLPRQSIIRLAVINTGDIDPRQVEYFNRLSYQNEFLTHSSLQRGLGIGLNLANVMISRAGGDIRLHRVNTIPPTVRAEIDLPVVIL